MVAVVSASWDDKLVMLVAVAVVFVVAFLHGGNDEGGLGYRVLQGSP